MPQTTTRKTVEIDLDDLKRVLKDSLVYDTDIQDALAELGVNDEPIEIAGRIIVRLRIKPGMKRQEAIDLVVSHLGNLKHPLLSLPMITDDDDWEVV